MDDFLEHLKTIWGILSISILVIGLIYCVFSDNSSKSNDPYRYEYHKIDRYQYQQKIERERQNAKQEQIRISQSSNNNYINYQTNHLSEQNMSRNGSPRSHYAALWSECEDYISILDDNDIEHEDLSYPMDYHDLEDFKDELESLLEENGIGY